MRNLFIVASVALMMVSQVTAQGTCLENRYTYAPNQSRLGWYRDPEMGCVVWFNRETRQRYFGPVVITPGQPTPEQWIMRGNTPPRSMAEFEALKGSQR